MSELFLQRDIYTPISTIGNFTYGDFTCYVLEDPVRKEKIYGETAIPAGRYRVAPLVSPSKRHIVIYLLNVPNYSGIQIHTGNTPYETKGCLIPALEKGDNVVRRSTEAYVKICELLCAEWNQLKETWITIQDKIGYSDDV